MVVMKTCVRVEKKKKNGEMRAVFGVLKSGGVRGALVTAPLMFPLCGDQFEIVQEKQFYLLHVMMCDLFLW